MDSVVKGRPLVVARGVTFHYDRTPVLRDVSLSIASGDFLAVIGPNGAGKTTLIKILLGLLKPSQGVVEIMGCPVDEFIFWEKIGYVPQKATNIDPRFPASVREVTAMALRSHRRKLGLSRKEEEAVIRRSLERVGMDALINMPIGHLSAGQQQRVFIARALVTEPRILFLDEPTTGVDPETRDTFYGILGRLNEEEGITIVLITHDVGIVDKRVTRVACLNQHLIYHGSHEEFCRSSVIKEMLAEGNHLVSHDH